MRRRSHGYTRSVISSTWVGPGNWARRKKPRRCRRLPHDTNTPSGTYCFGQDDDLDGPFTRLPRGRRGRGPASSVQIISPIGVSVGPTSSNQLYSHIRFTAGSGRGAIDAAKRRLLPYYSLLQSPGARGQGARWSSATLSRAPTTRWTISASGSVPAHRGAGADQGPPVLRVTRSGFLFRNGSC